MESYDPPGDPELLPVERIDWHAAENVLRKLDLVLPTEAQWEYGCRAGTQTIWSTGNLVASLAGAANLLGREHDLHESTVHGEFEDGYVTSAPVGTGAPNHFGLHDMHGNVSEWCRDDRLLFTKVPAREGDGLRCPPGADEPERRCIRGGSFRFDARRATSAFRLGFLSESTAGELGVRAARALER